MPEVTRSQLRRSRAALPAPGRQDTARVARPANHPQERLLALQHTVGNQAVQHLLSSRAIQAKLTVSQPGDRYEREADQVAETVMRMPDPAATRGVTVATPAQSGHIQRMCTECEEEIQRQPDDQTTRLHTNTGDPSVLAGGLPSQGSGQPLPAALRTFFEPRFGYDFSQVRIHTDAQAAMAAGAVQARAYTLGQTIVFGKGQYTPTSVAGQRLLAHELTHVVQQSGHRAGGATASGVPTVQRQPEPLEPPGPEPPFGCNVDIFTGKVECCATVPALGRVCAPDPATLKRMIEEALAKLRGQKPSTPPSLPFLCPPQRQIPDKPPPPFTSGGCCPEGTIWTGERCDTGGIIPSPLCPPSLCTEDEIWTGLPGADCCIPKPKEPPSKPPVQPSEPPLPSAVEIFFRFDRPLPGASGSAALEASLDSRGKTNFAALVKQLQDDPALRVQLVGRASPEGKEEYNLDLGKRRAELIAKALEDKQIDPSRITNPPQQELRSECQEIRPGLFTCGEAGATGPDDQQVMARVFRAP